MIVQLQTATIQRSSNDHTHSLLHLDRRIRRSYKALRVHAFYPHVRAGYDLTFLQVYCMSHQDNMTSTCERRVQQDVSKTQSQKIFQSLLAYCLLSAVRARNSRRRGPDREHFVSQGRRGSYRSCRILYPHWAAWTDCWIGSSISPDLASAHDEKTHVVAHCPVVDGALHAKNG